jgi:hypothetical protein
MSGSELLESASVWMARNAMVTLLPAALIAWVCWRRWGSARVRWALAGLLLVKLVTPGLPGWGWSVPGVAMGTSEAGLASVPGLEVGSEGTEMGVWVEEGGAALASGPAWWAVVWGAGVLALGGWWVAGVWRVNGWIQKRRVAAPAWLVRLLEEECRFMGLATWPELCVLRGWGQAAVHGCWRARVLLPADWVERLGEEEMRAVLRHELAHVRRRDVLWSTLGYGVAALNWFHPLGWLALRRLRAEAELLCDEAALTGHGEAGRKQYGRVLIRMMETFSPPPPNAVAAFARHRNDIQHRILMIAQPNRAQRWSRAMAWLILPTLSLALLTAGETREGEKEGRREGATERKSEGAREGVRDGERPREGARDGERGKEGVRDGEPTQRVAPREGARDGERGKEGERDRDGTTHNGGARDGEMRKEGPRDGERPREGGARDGERPKEGAREGEATQRVAPREGAREGERSKEGARDGEAGERGAAREGERGKEGMVRDGERGKEGGARDGEAGERGAAREGARDGGDSARVKPASTSTGVPAMVLKLNAQGEVVNGTGQAVPEAEVRQKLRQILAGNPNQGFAIEGDRATTYDSLMRVQAMVQELGGKDVRLGGAK